MKNFRLVMMEPKVRVIPSGDADTVKRLAMSQSRVRHLNDSEIPMAYVHSITEIFAEEDIELEYHVPG